MQGIQLVAQLEALHEQSYIHADLKPNNMAIVYPPMASHISQSSLPPNSASTTSTSPTAGHSKEAQSQGFKVTMFDFGDAVSFLTSDANPDTNADTSANSIDAPSVSGVGSGVGSGCVSGVSGQNRKHVPYCDGRRVLSSLQYASTNVLQGICKSPLF
jgi:serine/threonine protein kinase